MNSPLLEERHKGSVLYSVDGYDVIDCRECGFKHILPIPSESELHAIYREDYYAKEKPLYIQRYTEDIEWWNLVYDGWLDTLEELVPAGRRRILDVGSGPGLFLLRARQRGWDTLGVEPSAQAAEHARSLGLEIIQEPFSEHLASGLGTFGAVTMTEVLEHIPDPAALLHTVRPLLEPGGALLVTVPNDDNPFQRVAVQILGKPAWWIAPPHHINYFTPETLTGLVERCGFTVELCEGTFPIDLFLLMGRDYIGNDTEGRRCHRMRMQFEKNLSKAGLGELRRKFYRALITLGIGREVTVFAKAG